MFIQFIQTQGLNITVDQKQAEEILKNSQQICPVKDRNGKWTGETINKAYTTGTKPDRYAMKDGLMDLKNMNQELARLEAINPKTKEAGQKLAEAQQKQKDKIVDFREYLGIKPQLNAKN